MRLTFEQAQAIPERMRGCMDRHARSWRFGSRADGSRGGDVDLIVQQSGRFPHLVQRVSGTFRQDDARGCNTRKAGRRTPRRSARFSWSGCENIASALAGFEATEPRLPRPDPLDSPVEPLVSSPADFRELLTEPDLPFSVNLLERRDANAEFLSQFGVRRQLDVHPLPVEPV